MYAIALLGAYDVPRGAIIDRQFQLRISMTFITADTFLADAQSFLSGTGTTGGVNTDTFLADAQTSLSGTGSTGAGAIVSTEDFLAGAQAFLPEAAAIE